MTGACDRCGCAFEECECPQLGDDREPKVEQRVKKIGGAVTCSTCGAVMRLGEKYVHVQLAFTYGEEIEICRFCCSKINREAQKTDY